MVLIFDDDELLLPGLVADWDGALLARRCDDDSCRRPGQLATTERDRRERKRDDGIVG